MRIVSYMDFRRDDDPQYVLSKKIAAAAISTTSGSLMHRYKTKAIERMERVLTNFYLGFLEAGFPEDSISSGQVMKGRYILEIGCGRRNWSQHNDENPRFFEPWLCRILHSLGINITGIDISRTTNEDFNYLRANLTMPHSLSSVTGGSVDFLYESYFFDSPDTRKIPGFEAKVKRNLAPEIRRVMKQDGVFLTLKPTYPGELPDSPRVPDNRYERIIDSIGKVLA